MFQLMLWIAKALAAIRFCALPGDIQSIKTHQQISKYEKIVEAYFNFQTEDRLAEGHGFDVFMLLDKAEMVGYVKSNVVKAYSFKNRKEYDLVSFYCFMISDSYAGQGLSYKLFDESVNFLKKQYNLKNDAILALHLSSLNQKMPIASKIYYSYGFVKGMFIEYDPRQMIYNLDEMFDQSKDMLDVINGIEPGHGTGPFFLLYCFLKDFGKNRSKREIKVKDTQKLFDMLAKRRADMKTEL